MAKTPRSKIEITREEWAEAEKRWTADYSSGRNRGQDLSERQLGLLGELQKNGVKALNGVAVLVIKDNGGSFFSSYPYRGMILNTKEINNEYVLTVLYYPSDHEGWDGERVEIVHLSQIDQVQEVFLPIQDQIKEMKLLQIINVINRSRKQNIINIENKRKDYLNAIASKEKDIASYKKTVALYDAQIKASQIPDLSKEEVLKFFRFLAKNKKVVNAYVNMAGEMIVETAMLYATTPVKLLENKKKPVGRMIFLLNTQGISYCRFANLDYCYHSPGSGSYPTHYPHPNISSTGICSGNNQKEMDDMCKNGQFYELVDFLLLFFSMFPHDSGGPHIQHETWMASKLPEPKANPWETDQRLWELYPGKKTELPKKKEDYPEHQLDELAKFAAGRSNPEGLSVGHLRQRIISDLQAGNVPEFFQTMPEMTVTATPGANLTTSSLLEIIRDNMNSVAEEEE